MKSQLSELWVARRIVSVGSVDHFARVQDDVGRVAEAPEHEISAPEFFPVGKRLSELA